MQHNNRQEPTQIQSIASELNAMIKTHKEDKLNRPVINIQAPPYKLAKHLNKKT